jgi:phosphatidylglycerophosphate synthase
VSAAWIRPLPNLLTGLRLALACLLPFAPTGWRLAIVAVAGATDALDGIIARRFGAETALGKLLDGVADKAFAFAAVLTLALEGAISPLASLAVMTRDLVVVGIALWLAAHRAWGAFGQMQVRLPGKATTLFVFVWLLLLLLGAPACWATIAFVLAATSSVVAAIDYLAQLAQHVRRAAARGPGAQPPTQGAPQ